MIERLMDMERPYGEPEYSRLAREIIQLQKTLESQLEEKGIACLEQLSDAYIRQGSAALTDAFADGFRCAIEIMLDYLNGKTCKRKE